MELTGRAAQTLERWGRRGYLAALAVAIVLDGAVHYGGAAISLVLFSLVGIASVWIGTGREELRRLRIVSLGIVVGLVAVAVQHTLWRADTAAAHALWRDLAATLGTSGGVVGVNRFQPIWNIPAVVLPFVAFAAAIVLFRDRHSAQRFFVVAAVFGTVFAVYGAAQMLLFPEWYHLGGPVAYLHNLTGFYLNRNSAADLLFLTLVCTLIVIDDLLQRFDGERLAQTILVGGRIEGRERTLMVFAIFGFLQFVGIFLTLSRGGFLLVILGVIPLVGWRLVHLYRFDLRRYKWPLLIAAIGLLVLLSILSEQVGTRLGRQGFEDESRLCVYAAAIRLAVDNLPWGVGFGGFVDAFPAYRRPECGLWGVWETAHDGYIQGVVVMGVWFPVLLAVIVGALRRPLWRAAQSRRHGRFPAIAVWLAVVGMALHSLVDFPMEIPANAIMLATMIAAVLGRATGPNHGRRREARTSAGRGPRDVGGAIGASAARIRPAGEGV